MNKAKMHKVKRRVSVPQRREKTEFPAGFEHVSSID
jgi:hypothetical protein